MKIFNSKKLKISKKFAFRAALYRRYAKLNYPNLNLDYGYKALYDLYRKESNGIGPSLSVMLKPNGYALGKHLRDMFVSEMREDIISGNFCKAEFLTTPLEFLHNYPIIQTIPYSEFFIYTDLIQE